MCWNIQISMAVHYHYGFFFFLHRFQDFFYFASFSSFFSVIIIMHCSWKVERYLVCLHVLTCNMSPSFWCKTKKQQQNQTKISYPLLYLKLKRGLLMLATWFFFYVSWLGSTRKTQHSDGNKRYRDLACLLHHIRGWNFMWVSIFLITWTCLPGICTV